MAVSRSFVVMPMIVGGGTGSMVVERYLITSVRLVW